MFNTRRLRRADILLQFEFLIWLIHRDGPPILPRKPRKSRPFRGVESRYWRDTDTQTVFDWAHNIFEMVKTDCGMAEWPVQIAPGGQEEDRANILEFKREDRKITNTPYRIDRFGRAQIGYDPRLCSQPGYLMSTIILKLSEYRALNFKPVSGDLNRDSIAALCLIGGAYSGQGFRIASNKNGVSDFLHRFGSTDIYPEKFTSQVLAFAICLNLLANGKDKSDIVKSYKSCAPKSFIKKMKISLKQISQYQDELDQLCSLTQSIKSSHNEDRETESIEDVIERLSEYGSAS